MDLNGARVTMPGWRALKARVVWQDGRLYVATSLTDVRSFDVPEPPRRRGMWQALTGDGVKIWIVPSGCGGCNDKKLAALSVAELMALADSVTA